MTDPDTHKPTTAPTTNVIPEMVIKRDTVFIHKDDIERVLMDKLPGYIPDVSGGAQMPGCRLITFNSDGDVYGLPDDIYVDFEKKTKECFTPADMINAFFQNYANYILVKMFPDGMGNVYVEYTSMLNEEDTGDLQEISAEQRKAMNEKRAARAATKAEADAKAKVELDRLMAIAKQVQESGGLAILVDTLTARVAELELENKQLSRKVKKR